MDSTNNYLWNTFDFCKSVQGFSLPFKPTDLLLHSRRSNLVLGYDGSHPNKQVKTGNTILHVVYYIVVWSGALSLPPEKKKKNTCLKKRAC